jgi:hypothetical protein
MLFVVKHKVKSPMPPHRTLLPGVLARGYRVASGPSRDYPYGALDRS